MKTTLLAMATERSGIMVLGKKVKNTNAPANQPAASIAEMCMRAPRRYFVPSRAEDNTSRDKPGSRGTSDHRRQRLVQARKTHRHACLDSGLHCAVARCARWVEHGLRQGRPAGMLGKNEG